MASQAVQIQRETLQACMTCPLCHNLFNEATTISLCLHTFCRKCIYEKLSDEEVDSCPVCNIDLGCLPVEKLRPDNNVQDIRSKIFPFRRRKTKVPEIVPSTSLPAKRKERSLSSLVVSAPKVSKQTGTGKRTKTGPRIRRDDLVGTRSLREVARDTVRHSLEAARGVDILYRQLESLRHHVTGQRHDFESKIREEVALKKQFERHAALLGSQVKDMQKAQEDLLSELVAARAAREKHPEETEEKDNSDDLLEDKVPEEEDAPEESMSTEAAVGTDQEKEAEEDELPGQEEEEEDKDETSGAEEDTEDTPKVRDTENQGSKRMAAEHTSEEATDSDKLSSKANSEPAVATGESMHINPTLEPENQGEIAATVTLVQEDRSPMDKDKDFKEPEVPESSGNADIKKEFLDFNFSAFLPPTTPEEVCIPEPEESETARHLRILNERMAEHTTAIKDLTQNLKQLEARDFAKEGSDGKQFPILMNMILYFFTTMPSLCM